LLSYSLGGTIFVNKTARIVAANYIVCDANLCHGLRFRLPELQTSQRGPKGVIAWNNLLYRPQATVASKIRAALLPKLPFEADVMLCDGRDLLRLETANPFGTQPSPPAVVRFVSILGETDQIASEQVSAR
jgi:hypothetical protein